MSRSPNSLGDMIRIVNSDLSSFNIVTVNGKNYITESSVYNFAKENGISNINYLINSISEYNGINELHTMNGISCDYELNRINDIMSLFESINPIEVSRAAKGRYLLMVYINQLVAFITNREYDNTNNLKKYIHRCDKVLSDIEEEKKKCREKGAKDDSYKFSIMYIFNIAFTLFEIFVAPKIIINRNIQWPAAVQKLFVKNSAKFAAGKTIAFAGKSIKRTHVIKGMALAVSVPDDIRGLYLSFADYEKLLTEYEIQIKKCRNNLDDQLKNIKNSKKEETSNMFALKEDYTDPNVADVKYQDPGELEVGAPATVVHDDSPVVTNDMEVPKSDFVEDNGTENTIDIPAIDDHHEHDHHHGCDHEHHHDFDPIEKIKVAKYNPMNITIVKYDDTFYVSLDDIKAMMKLYDCDDYDDAIDKLIDAHKDSGINSDNIKIVMSKDDLEDLDESSTQIMEESNVQFEVY